MSKFIVSPYPHIHSRSSTTQIMRDVLIALVPAAVASVIFFGFRALLVIAVCTLSAVFFEWVFTKITKRPDTTKDLSACVTGVLLAYNLPVTIPLWQCVVGSAVAIILVKQLFGGLGRNFANPAITARIFMFLAFAKTMSTYVTPDGVTGATPLAFIAEGGLATGGLSQLDLFLGNHGGCLGEVSAIALLLGFVYLVFRRVITLEIPVTFIGTVFILSAVGGWNPVDSILSGGLLLGAIFMATDYVTGPITSKGRIVFGIGCGVFTMIIRLYGGYPEGVSFAILLMNIVTPYINMFTKKKAFGGVSE